MDARRRFATAQVGGVAWTPLEIYVEEDEEAQPKPNKKQVLRPSEEKTGESAQALSGLGSPASISDSAERRSRLFILNLTGEMIL